MKKGIVIALLLGAFHGAAQETIEVKDQDLYQMNKVLGVFGGESIAATFWQLENLSFLYVNESISDENATAQLQEIVNRMNSGTAEVKLMMASELWADESLQASANTVLSLREALADESTAFLQFIKTKDEVWIEVIESKRAFVNSFFGR